MPTHKIPEEKLAIDKIIKKSRVHFYKPIQIAEILYHDRTRERMDLDDLESYRSVSKRWRDDITLRLVGRKSTSSAKYQDNLFEDNAVPPNLLAKLGNLNRKRKGCVEAYVYASMKARLSSVLEVEKYVSDATPKNFDIVEFEALFRNNPGLRRSVDKMYEIAVYALFTSLVRELRAQVTVEVLNKDPEILRDFEYFLKTVIGITSKKTSITLPAALYRVGVTNAADRGLDMFANFGAAIQVKHLTLTPDSLEDIADNIPAAQIVVVCKEQEKEAIDAVLKQVGWGERIQGIITLTDLANWYGLCLGTKYRKRLGQTLLADLAREFKAEFPSSEHIDPFIKERLYDKVGFPKGWEIASDG